MNMFNNLKLKWKLVTGFSLPLILLVIIATTVNFSIAKLLKTQGWVEHTHEVVEIGNDITSSLVNMETGLRGFLITGENGFLEPYNDGNARFGDLINAGKKKVSDNPEQAERLSKVERLADAWKHNHVEISMKIRRDVNAGTTEAKEITVFIEKAIGKQYMDQMRGHLNDFIAAEAVLIKVRKDEQTATADITTSITIFGTLIALILGGIAAFIIIRNLLTMLGGEPSYAMEVVSAIADGKLNTDVEAHPNDTSSLLYSMKIMRENLLERATADKNLADETSRIKLALDVCSTNVMMADTEFNINYMNAAVQNMMKVAESDLRAVLPSFDANNLMGNNIDVFHKNPAHQRQMLGHLQTPYSTEIKVGVRTFGLIATPIFNTDKERLGTVVEWDDRTAEVALEVEVDTLIKAANEGNLKGRIDLNGKSGFFEALSAGLNNLMDKTSAFVGDVGEVFEAMSEGNLTETITNNYMGELQDIKNNANNSIMKLNEVLSKIQSASETVRSSSTEVAEGSDDLSRRTESQASSLEETASSMEEMTAAVKQSAENSSESSSLAQEAKLKAQQGGDVVQGTVTAMREIMESSNKINDIIGVIDEIAFQTNLLALNAAVEAARAGEQGRGFAVVAGEVRTLSQRSAAAAKEIKDLIRDSVNKVESGSALVNQSGQVLSDIVSAVDNVAIRINDVNTAAIEQNSGITQINQAIAQMDEMTQQNAALVEETSAASRSMSEEATSMNRLISFFRLTNSGGSSEYSTQARAPEAVISYQPKASPAPNAAAADNSKDAASFSSKDDWEDF